MWSAVSLAPAQAPHCYLGAPSLVHPLQVARCALWPNARLSTLPGRHMADSAFANHAEPRLVVVVNGGSPLSVQDLTVPLRYAASAAAMDVHVELHAVGPSVAWLRRGAADAGLLTRLRTAVELGVDIFVCPQAMADQGLRFEDLIDEVLEVRGAASLLHAGLAPGARLLSF